MSVLQLIDEHKQFVDCTAFFQDEKVLKAGLAYHLVAVFGSQSTGKSTLLNALFSTQFGTMDQLNRQQTTKGIWMGVDHQGPEPLLVLDVEGTDGRERGEDQDFERKSALFALASAEVLIVNMWEHQVGLYQGANMGLLKTVFEVNLQLFQSSGKVPRSRILFVIRDHVGTPLASLGETLLADLRTHWSSISKPPHLASSALEDYFDVDFVALPHKLLQPELFVAKVGELRSKFASYFKSEYHRQIPIDGWPHYSEQIWAQIEQNKDLDLPTQQILVARFRCQEIAEAAWTAFTASLATSTAKFGGPTVIDKFGALLTPMRASALEAYDAEASKYTESVYTAERAELVGRLDTLLLAHFKAQLDAAAVQTVAAFRRDVEELVKTQKFAQSVTEARATAVKTWTRIAEDSALDADTYVYRQDLEEFEQGLDSETQLLRAAQEQKLLSRLAKRIGAELGDTVPAQFRPPTPQSWAGVVAALRSAVDNATTSLPSDFGLGGSDQDTQRTALHVEFEAWKALDAQLVDLCRSDSLVTRLRDVFDDKFQYDSNGTPILWKAGDDIAAVYAKARDAALGVLSIFAQAPLEVPVALEDLYRAADYEAPEYRRLVSSARQDQVKARFLKDADTAFLNAKRSVQHTSMQIPVWMWGLLVVLGWNEFMVVLRNPLLIMLLVLMGGGFYVLWTLGMTAHALSVAQATLAQVQKVVKERVREWVNEHEGGAARAASSEKAAGGTAAGATSATSTRRSPPGSPIELDDLESS